MTTMLTACLPWELQYRIATPKGLVEVGPQTYAHSGIYSKAKTNTRHHHPELLLMASFTDPHVY